MSELQTIILEKIKGDSKALKIYRKKVQSKEPLEEIAKFFNINTMKITLKEKRNKEVSIAYQLINEAYSKLSPIEKEYVSLVASKSKVRVYNQVRLVEALITGLKSNKERELANECLKVLKKDIVKRPLEEAAERTLELKQTITNLLEADEVYGGMLTKSLGNLKYLKNIKLSLLSEEVDSPETLYITWSVAFYPLGNDFSSVKASLLDLDKRFGNMGRNILNKTIREKGRTETVFTGEGIWDGGVKTNAVKPGGETLGKGELALHIKRGSVKSIEEAKRVVVPVLRDIDSYIPQWFPEVDKVAQKDFRKNPEANTQARLDTLKRAFSNFNAPKGSDNFSGAL